MVWSAHRGRTVLDAAVPCATTRSGPYLAVLRGPLVASGPPGAAAPPARLLAAATQLLSAHPAAARARERRPGFGPLRAAHAVPVCRKSARSAVDARRGCVSSPGAALGELEDSHEEDRAPEPRRR